jgi:hypothetical protein
MCGKEKGSPRPPVRCERGAHALYSVDASRQCYTPSVQSQYESKVKTTATRLIFLLVSLALLVGCGSYRVISAWEVPKGYRGWVLVEQSNPKCPPAKFTLTKVIFTVDSSGHGCVSTPLPKASELLTFWEVDSEGIRTNCEWVRETARSFGNTKMPGLPTNSSQSGKRLSSSSERKQNSMLRRRLAPNGGCRMVLEALP